MRSTVVHYGHPEELDEPELCGIWSSSNPTTNVTKVTCKRCIKIMKSRKTFDLEELIKRREIR